MRFSLRNYGEENRLRISRVKSDGSDSGDDRIAGRNGHLANDNGKLQLIFCDEDAKRPHTPLLKTNALKRIKDYVIGISQEGDCEFIAHVDPSGIEAFIRVLRIKRRMSTFGQPKPPELAERLRQSLAARRISKSCKPEPSNEANVAR